MIDLAAQLERVLLNRKGWVSTEELCRLCGTHERALRAKGDTAGLLDHCAVSSTRQGQHGYIHHRFLSTAEWLPIKHRLRRHAIAELRKVQRWSNGRAHVLTQGIDHQWEAHTGQGLLTDLDS